MGNHNYYGNDYTARPDGQYYGAPQQSYGGAYSSYEPPKDNGYRHDTTVARYDAERNRYEEDRRFSTNGRDRNRYHEGSRGSDDDRDYSPERRRSSSRPRSRGLREGEHKKQDHDKSKEVGATLIGGAVGAFAGHELGHNSVASTIGALAGAWGGHAFEKRHEKKKERRESGEVGYSQRSVSRSRSRRDDYDDDGDDRRHHHKYHDSDRYD